MFPSRAEIYYATTSAGKRYVDFVASFLDRGSANLELGSGAGRLLVPLADAGYEMVGLDWDDDMLEIASAQTRERGLEGRVKLVKGDFRSTSLGRRFGAAFFSTDTVC